jgi:iron complex outermembrane receptor protein
MTPSAARDRSFLRRTPCALAALAALLAPAAWAQSAAPAPAAAASAAAPDAAPGTGTDAPAVQSVTVTGNGRAQQLQNVPIAVQLVDAAQIDKLAASNLGDMNGFVPGLHVNAEQPTQPFFVLRGIGTGDFGIGTDAPVGVYVDGVYTGKTGGALLNFNDVKRVEVLEGPQGTLFGRNSAGGAISVVTNEPNGRFAANGLLRVGSWGTKHVEAMVNDPLNEDFALRVSAVGQFSNGWQREAATGQRERGDHAWGTRTALRWSPSTETAVVLSWEHEDLKQRAMPSIGLLATPAFGADPATYLDPRKAPLHNDAAGDGEARRFDGLTLRAERSLGWADFTSTTAVRHFTSRNVADNDGSANEATTLTTGNFERNTTVQQEFKLAGRNETVDWLGGASLFWEKADQTSAIYTNTDSLDTLYGNVAGVAPFQTIDALAQGAGVPGIDLSHQDWQEDMVNAGRYRAFALYGDAIWHLGRQTDLTTGLRLTHDDKRFSWYSPPRSAPGVDAQLAALAAGGFFPALVAAGALSQQDADTLQALATQGRLIDGTGAQAAPLAWHKSWNNASPRLVLDHHLSPDAMVYASVTRGYQSGGFNALQVGGAYSPETVTSYELGAKGQWAAAGLGYSAAFFHYDYRNLQSLTLVASDTPGGIPVYAVTHSDEQADGLDLDLRWRATAHLTLFGAAEFIDQKYRRDTASDGTDLSGQPVGTPRVTATAGIDVGWALAGGKVDATLQGAYIGATRCNDDSVAQGTCLTTPAFRVGAPQTRIDARLAWDSAPAGQPGWGVALVATNLANKRYITEVNYVAAPLGSPWATITPPRFFGIELRGSL